MAVSPLRSEQDIVKEALILGCGPTGLIAAHACRLAGVHFTILSKKRKSELYGSQYLHGPIEDIVGEAEGEWVKYVNVGTPEQYRRKTHGKFWDGIIAPEDFETKHMAWDIRTAYQRLWRKYSDFVVNFDIESYAKLNHFADLALYDVVISSIPRTLWKLPGEKFTYSQGWTMGDAPERGVFVPYEVDDMTIVCDGSESVHYNRLSKVFGYTTVEWPDHTDTSLLPGGAAKFTKPLRCETDQDNPTNHPRWLHVGRFGEWQKGVVVTDAFDAVTNRLKES